MFLVDVWFPEAPQSSCAALLTVQLSCDFEAVLTIGHSLSPDFHQHMLEGETEVVHAGQVILNYLTASRSPPGLEALSVSSSAHFGVIFGVVFGSWGQYGGAAGSFFGADGDLARQRRLKRRLPQNKVTILDPSWEPKPTKNDQKSMPRCVQILHWFSDRFLIDS